MNIVVLIKEVPDMDRVKFDKEKGVVDRSSAEAEINPFDMHALQAAVDLKKKYNANVTVVTMGPPRAEKSLRDAYARGADKCVLLTDRKFGGSDTYATAITLASAIQRIKDCDLIICGEKSVDGDTAQVGAEVAEFLDLPHTYYVEKIISINETEIEVVSSKMRGSKQIRKMKLPALIGVNKNINIPQLPTLKRKLESLNIGIEKLGMDDLLDYMTEENTGFKGSPTKVSKIEIPKEASREGRIFRDDRESFIKAFIAESRC
ncbi:MAG: electron transfer flavoprotein, beta subunit [Clostridia bacterium BRH_c25]|nr:MAG: electron transfer flavoprotein, beta subunit [Clostridia bacterium BRH_c25]